MLLGAALQLTNMYGDVLSGIRKDARIRRQYHRQKIYIDHVDFTGFRNLIHSRDPLFSQAVRDQAGHAHFNAGVGFAFWVICLLRPTVCG
jgi:hypothetical protein